MLTQIHNFTISLFSYLHIPQFTTRARVIGKIQRLIPDSPKKDKRAPKGKHFELRSLKTDHPQLKTLLNNCLLSPVLCLLKTTPQTSPLNNSPTHQSQHALAP